MSKSETYKAEIMALWRSQGLALDEIRIRIFDSMPEWAQRDVVEQVRAEVKVLAGGFPLYPKPPVVSS